MADLMESVERLVSGSDWVGKRAPELASGMQWLNSKPLAMKELKGKVVLLDFWTYSCVNCLRTLPYLKQWHKKYSGRGLVIIGVHSPEFGFEKKPENVAAAVEALGVKYPVVLDSDYRVWNAWKNAWWPRKLLIDAPGVVRYDHVGEGSYEETEAQIVKLLKEANPALKIEEKAAKGKPERGAVCYPTTAELYCGYSRGAIGNREGYGEERIAEYADEGRHEEGKIYLQGSWLAREEYAYHTGKAGHIQIKFRASTVNAVMSSEKPCELEVTVDGKPLTKENAGSDVVVERDRSFIRVREPRMYNIIRLKRHATREVRLSAKGPFYIYAYTFGACEGLDM
jgi:thiol-disulfide isomerase/thioredoxin